MRYLTIAEVLAIHQRLLETSGGAAGVRSFDMLLSALAQPQMSFGGQELYPTISHKAAALCYSLVMNHPFIDGNKRIGHAATEVFLTLNGFELAASVDDAENVILSLAAGTISRDELLSWMDKNIQPLN